MRVSWNPETTRLRLGVLDEAGQPFPVLGLRREFGGFELEAHALYESRPVVGLGGSGSRETYCTRSRYRHPSLGNPNCAW